MHIDWRECSLVETVPGNVSGAPVIRGTRVRPEDLVVNRSQGLPWLVENFGIPAETVRAVFTFYDWHKSARAWHSA